MWSAIFAEPISEIVFICYTKTEWYKKYSLDNGELAETLE